MLLPSVPFTPTIASDSCGEMLGLFSYWFNFVSNLAPLDHMKITRTGFMDVPARMSALDICHGPEIGESPDYDNKPEHTYSIL